MSRDSSDTNGKCNSSKIEMDEDKSNGIIVSMEKGRSRRPIVMETTGNTWQLPEK